ncbi:MULTISPECIES: DUF3038 domain-containing protein [Cyanophyceae]|uniref:DUF3038 domain-containing protein n=1 Tax=Cyanophyceae TaxID=3028117 RepID=UPI00016DC6B3|nr:MULTISPECIES: DUF3038 domain-containing protein [Cyanophyceae]ACA99077.1 conserved hypothetical protein [Picosynechococcus sp. PCC 7002]AMA08820.1 hypothetical protein AWQ23_05535 [Picosynechococcus sp. PCC 73109]ANV83932.1 hypothetical protein AWQ21_05775 [Picosynechococcus sp. PCC 7003]QCS49566.1 DUF3038 domain-containing protein [Picosynechococcus sp. PCC 11901]SMH35147.1 Protein of unknown function [Picosynechococcus sp. OG1]
MRPSLQAVPTPASFADLPLAQPPDGQQLENIKSHLDLVLLALESLAGLSSEAMLQAAKELNLEAVIGDRVTLWRLRQSNPLRKSSGGRKKLDVEEARSLVLIICHLARQQQDDIRRACALLEQMTEQGQEPHRAALLGDYLDNFSNTYQERMEEGEAIASASLVGLALKLLIDLLFYGAKNGHRRLWLALIDQGKT